MRQPHCAGHKVDPIDPCSLQVAAIEAMECSDCVHGVQWVSASWRCLYGVQSVHGVQAVSGCHACIQCLTAVFPWGCRQ
jgi:hypothetical protein